MFSFIKKKPYTVYGPQGGISTNMVLPQNFNTAADHCPIVVLMHGFMSKKEMHPIPAIAKALAAKGIAAISFDFNAHGRSEGKFVDMTLSKEIEDAKAVLEYVKSLPCFDDIAFLGHSQGGLVAGMLAGQLEDTPLRPSALVLMAPAAVLKDDAIAGQCMNAKYNPSDPPEYVKVFFRKLGRDFILEAQKFPIYETSGLYTGKVCLLHGLKDKIVPVDYSRRYKDGYKDCELHLLENEGHFFNNNKKEVLDKVVNFLSDAVLPR